MLLLLLLRSLRGPATAGAVRKKKSESRKLLGRLVLLRLRLRCPRRERREGTGCTGESRSVLAGLAGAKDSAESGVAGQENHTVDILQGLT